MVAGLCWYNRDKARSDGVVGILQQKVRRKEELEVVKAPIKGKEAVIQNGNDGEWGDA